ncbi:MAG: hypothetical protein ACXWUE_24715 [Polyangiales bacterium]
MRDRALLLMIVALCGSAACVIGPKQDDPLTGGATAEDSGVGFDDTGNSKADDSTVGSTDTSTTIPSSDAAGTPDGSDASDTAASDSATSTDGPSTDGPATDGPATDGSGDSAEDAADATDAVIEGG